MKRLILIICLFFLLSGCGGGWYGYEPYQDYGGWNSFQQQMLMDEMIHQQMQTQFELQSLQLQMSGLDPFP